MISFSLAVGQIKKVFLIAVQLYNVLFGQGQIDCCLACAATLIATNPLDLLPTLHRLVEVQTYYIGLEASVQISLSVVAIVQFGNQPRRYHDTCQDTGKYTNLNCRVGVLLDERDQLLKRIHLDDNLSGGWACSVSV